jgi:hypothetical protein
LSRGDPDQIIIIIFEDSRGKVVRGEGEKGTRTDQERTLSFPKKLSLLYHSEEDPFSGIQYKNKLTDEYC